MELKDLAPIAIVFLVVTILISVGATVTDKISTNVVEATTLTDGFDGWYPANSTDTFTLSNARVSSLVARNVTGNVLVHSANYTLDESLGTIVLVSGSSFNGSNLNLTYSYDVDSGVAWAAAGNGTSSLGELASWLPVLGLAIAAALLLGILGSYFMYRKN